MSLTPKVIMAGMPAAMLPRLCVVYEVEAGPGEDSNSWRASYFPDRTAAQLLLRRCREDRTILQYEIFKLGYSSDGGGRRGPRMEG